MMPYEFNEDRSRSQRWAEEVIPILFELTGVPASAVDLGGGHGQWLAVMKRKGVSKVTCIDHPSMGEGCVLDDHEFVGLALDKTIPKAVKSDMAISIEFAEHVPMHKSDEIVEFLTQSAPVILFSAATPFQPGVNHVNGQWAPYWHHKFEANGFRLCDSLRWRLLFNQKLPFWLKTNLFVYLSIERESDFPQLADSSSPCPTDIQLVHMSALPDASPLAAYATKALVKETITRLAGLPIRMGRRLLGSN
jgi:hypothetical protein